MKTAFGLMLALVLASGSALADACPDLRGTYQGTVNDQRYGEMTIRYVITQQLCDSIRFDITLTLADGRSGAGTFEARTDGICRKEKAQDQECFAVGYAGDALVIERVAPNGSGANYVPNRSTYSVDPAGDLLELNAAYDTAGRELAQETNVYRRQEPR